MKLAIAETPISSKDPLAFAHVGMAMAEHFRPQEFEDFEASQSDLLAMFPLAPSVSHRHVQQWFPAAQWWKPGISLLSRHCFSIGHRLQAAFTGLPPGMGDWPQAFHQGTCGPSGEPLPVAIDDFAMWVAVQSGTPSGTSC